MTYSLGLVPEATRQTATWWKLMPGVIAWLRAAYPSDAFIGSLTAKAESAGPVFIGTTGDGSRMFFIDADRHGSYAIPGVKYTAPGGADARPMTYEMVRAVFAVAPDTDPSTKPSPVTAGASVTSNRSSKTGLYIGLGIGGLLLAAGIAYAVTRKPTPALAKNRRVKRNSSFGPARDSAAARARAAFARGDGAAANRALAELRAIDIGLMPRAVRRNPMMSDGAWRRALKNQVDALGMYLCLIESGPIGDDPACIYPAATAADRKAALALVKERYPDVDLQRAYGIDGIRMNPAYAIPERHAYPITTAKDAYHASQRLKQGRVRNEAEAKRIIAAIRHRHPAVWRQHLAGYPVSRIIASKRRGLAARHVS